MKKNDLLEIETFKMLWENKEENEKFLLLLSYFKIDITKTKLLPDEKYVILYDRKKKEYIAFFSKMHPLEEDFLQRKERYHMDQIRMIVLE